MKHVAIIGAGWAGLAAAVELAARGIPVTVFEAARTLGGRARTVSKNGIPLDNGQHILIGAYRETLRLMGQVGVDIDRALLRLPLTLVYPGALELRAPRLPAPWHVLLAVLSARRLGWRDRLGTMRFMQTLHRSSFQLPEDCSVTALLDRTRQTPALRRYLWEPLCVAALNTPADAASAQVFANVLRDSLAADAAASDLLLPRTDLGALFPETARTFIEAHGGRIVTGTPIRALQPHERGYVLDGDPEQQRYSHVVVAVAPQHLDPLIEPLPQLASVRAAVAAFAYEPIVTCYLAYDTHPALPAPMIGMAGEFTQWLFDRGQLNGQPGMLAAVISARGRHRELDRETLAASVHEEICAQLGNLPEPRWTQVITEKRATFSCAPNLKRPKETTPLPGLLLCGDYVASDYPATLEAAVRSGVRCAAFIAG